VSTTLDLFRRRREVLADTSLRGRAFCRALSDATDEVLASLLADATGGDVAGLALVASGGYGRAQLAPASDLDVWLLHDDRPGVHELAEQLWYPIWDAGLKLGHAVRTHRETLALVGTDLDTATAALSARHLAGDPAVSARLSEEAQDRWRKRSGRWLSELRRRVEARHLAEGEVAFLLEPDLKEGRGGLRDVHALQWAEAARHVLQRGDSVMLGQAEDVLLDVRVALHRVVGKPAEQLLLERQDDVARLLADGDADDLMARVSTAARTVAWVSDEVWGRVGRAEGFTRRFRRPRSIAPGVVLSGDEIHLAAGTDPADDPLLVLRAGAAAAEHEVPIDRSSLDRLADRAPTMPDPWPDGARDALVELLGTGRRAIPVLEALDQRRLVERVLPEWAPVRSKLQRNALHRFTVDRHLFETAANAASFTATVARPDLLLVGALLHDLGKGYPGDHTDAGIELLHVIGPRMGYPPEDVEVLVRLVRHHLLLADVATRRDIGDDDVVAGVVEAVGSLGTLELLHALTEADSLATGSSVWGAWKAELVNQLVDRAAHVLRGGDTEVTRPAGFPDRAVLELMAQHRTTVRVLPPQVTVVAPDRPGLFSRVAGTLALKGLTVVAADAASEDGMASSQFRVEWGDVEVDWEEVTSDLRRAIDGRLAIDARLGQRAKVRRPSAALRLVEDPSVRVDNHGSGTCTIVEVRAPDRPGVLYRITRALADLDLDIRTAKVATLGPEVVDSFYVQTASGGKLADREHVRELERAILHQLSI
jgi:[protein-PII] uridylyltransferase